MSPPVSPDGTNPADVFGDSMTAAHMDDNPNAGIPRQKRLACLICRRRKLKCDGRRPSCSTCSRLGHPCSYDEVRKKSGPKRGYVKALEERLKQVEVMLKSQDNMAVSGSATAADALKGYAVDGGPGGSVNAALPAERTPSAGDFHVADPSMGLSGGRDMERWQFNGESPPPRQGSLDEFNFGSRIPMNDIHPVDGNFTWEIINLGLDEPLPPQETIDELHQVYFDKIHPSLPMIHKYRYLAAMNLAPNQRPPVCLRYAMWMLACSVTDKYNDLKDLFYQRARKYLEADYVKGYGEHMISVAHCQTHIVLASYEFKMMYFPRAWQSTGQAVRLAQMIGLHRLDGSGLDVKQCLPPPRDWTEKEERRRTFWMAYCEDRYASIGTGWPMIVDERDITTLLPTSEEAFDMSRPEPGVSLQDAMCPSGIGQLTSFAGIVLMACLFGRNLTHFHRPDADERDDDLNGEFWKRHRNLDNILLNTLLGLPAHLKLPTGLQNPNIVFTNMSIHTSTICLHQAAIFKAEKNGLASSVSPESKIRCINAANEIASIMPRVFVQFLKTRPDQSTTVDSLRFLLTAMGALKRKNPLTESFLVQLDVDLEALADRIPELRTAFPSSNDSRKQPASGCNVLGRQGASCDEGPGDGILSYQKEISKSITEVNANTSNSGTGDMSEDTGTRDRNSGSSSTSTSANGGGNGAGPHGWLKPEPRLPTCDRSSNGHSPMFQMAPGTYPDQAGQAISMQGYAQGDTGTDSHELSSTSPSDMLSNRPTPNSSVGSEQRQTLAPLPQPGPSHMHSAAGPYDASPVSPAHGIGGKSVRAGRITSSFYAAASGIPSEYGSQPSLSSAGLDGMMSGPSSGEYTLSAGWSLPAQTAMTPVSEGVLHTIMQMGPMETMDLGWDANP
ncbi:c6 zinc finger domain containing protein [Grosmannia clavigera kw1407]|uniref:C6 zinc finger domain containing protein n=1 Tax=Grosmannia clavigera (strain kw1407 / UAMH 11150) TaxID=655863 RepID=F0XC85_GROCL|nr:c6 zinc finger domain containing protein [Grosmannia clavigera kw1407]EFX04748.1 c6 zinc finger domain containing protein [Grosmannia clavigera kw1407]